MGWARFDDAYADHPKVVAAGPMAELLDVRAILFCARYETDGHVLASQLPRLSVGIPTPTKHVRRLVEVRRWDEADDGWIVHDYLDYNPSKAQKDAEREAAKERMRSARDRKNARRSSSERTPNKQRSSGNPDPAPAPSSEPTVRGEDANAGQLMAEHLEACSVRPPGQVVGQTSKIVKQLLGEGYTPAQIRSALGLLREKATHPSTLPSLLNEVLNPRRLRAVGDGMTRMKDGSVLPL